MIQEEASEPRNRVAAAMSGGWPIRPSGNCEASCSRRSSSSGAHLVVLDRGRRETVDPDTVARELACRDRAVADRGRPRGRRDDRGGPPIRGHFLPRATITGSTESPCGSCHSGGGGRRGWLGREGAGVGVRLWLGAARSDTASLLAWDRSPRGVVWWAGTSRLTRGWVGERFDRARGRWRYASVSRAQPKAAKRPVFVGDKLRARADARAPFDASATSNHRRPRGAEPQVARGVRPPPNRLPTHRNVTRAP